MSWSRDPVIWSTWIHTARESITCLCLDVILEVQPNPWLHSNLWSSTKSLTSFKFLKFNQIFPCNWIFFQTELSSNIPTYSVSPTKLSLMLQFYDVRAYLWSASRRGSGGFSWRISVLAPEATDLLVLLTRCPTRWTQQGWLSGGEGCQLPIARNGLVWVKPNGKKV